MKTDPNNPVQMMYDLDGHPVGLGLTKREYFAALAMQSMADNDEPLIEIANQAVLLADELIMALNRTADQKF